MSRKRARDDEDPSERKPPPFPQIPATEKTPRGALAPKTPSLKGFRGIAAFPEFPPSQSKREKTPRAVSPSHFSSLLRCAAQSTVRASAPSVSAQLPRNKRKPTQKTRRCLSGVQLFVPEGASPTPATPLRWQHSSRVPHSLQTAKARSAISAVEFRKVLLTQRKE